MMKPGVNPTCPKYSNAPETPANSLTALAGSLQARTKIIDIVYTAVIKLPFCWSAASKVK